MIKISVQINDGIIIVEPTDRLEQSDFEKLANEIDAFPQDKNRLIGLIIYTKSFPGWDDFNAFFHHMKFVKDHHKEIQRIAIVTDSKIGAIAPGIVNHFVSARIKHFEYVSIEEAKQWIQKTAG